MSVSTLLGLLFCNVLWSGAYSLSKGLMVNYHPMEVAFLRYLTAAVPLLVYSLWGGRNSLLIRWLKDLRSFDWRIVIIGALTFFVSPFCQMTGLNKSRAIDGSLMIAMEPLFTIVAACALLRESLKSRQIFSLLLAITGAGILTDLTWEKASSFTDARLIGNLIFLGSMFSEAAYSTVSKPILDRRTPVLMMTVSLWIGLLLLLGYNLILDDASRMAGLSIFAERQSVFDLLSYLYLGLGCTLFAYLFWMIVLQNTTVSSMALTLYLQPVLGVIWGSAFLGETITVTTCVGGILIFAAVWLGSRG